MAAIPDRTDHFSGTTGYVSDTADDRVVARTAIATFATLIDRLQETTEGAGRIHAVPIEPLEPLIDALQDFLLAFVEAPHSGGKRKDLETVRQAVCLFKEMLARVVQDKRQLLSLSFKHLVYLCIHELKLRNAILEATDLHDLVEKLFLILDDNPRDADAVIALNITRTLLDKIKCALADQTDDTLPGRSRTDNPLSSHLRAGPAPRCGFDPDRR